jgi:transcriptional regulator with XRE-family HTH domain
MSGIAKQLKQLRTAHSKRLKDIAAETGLSVSYLSDIERGHRAVFDTALTTLNKILACYGLEARLEVRVIGDDAPR